MLVCRLCLDVLTGGPAVEAFKLLDNEVSDTLQILIPELNLHVSPDPLSCSVCYSTLDKLWRFKLSFLEVEEKIRSLVSEQKNGTFSLADLILESRNLEEASSTKKIRFCRTCLAAIELESFTVLKPSEPDYYLNNMVSMCLPEMDLDVLNDPVMCETCLDNLQTFHHFKSSCLGVEDRIQLYAEQHGTNSSNYVNLSSILESSVDEVKPGYCSSIDDFSTVNFKTECAEDSNVKIEDEGDSSDDTFNEDEGATVDSQMKEEEVLIEDDGSQDGMNENCDEPEKKCKAVRKKSKPKKVEEVYPKVHCEFCRKLLYKVNMKRHIRRMHSKILNCSFCQFSTKDVHQLNQHQLVKHTEKLRKYFQCATCDFHTVYKSSLEKHINYVHFAETYSVSCVHCEFKCRDKYTLANHVKYKHHILEVAKCPKCDYTTNKTYLKYHMKFVHGKNVTYLNCDFCCYQTKRRGHLNRHLKDKHDGRVTLHSCVLCEYQTKQASNLKRHIDLTHGANVVVHKCLGCEFATKHKESLKKHIRKLHPKLA